MLPQSFGNVVADASSNGVIQRQGYYYKMILPGNESASPIGGIDESPTGGNNTTLPGPRNAELMWCCYAWPVSAGKSGRRAFFIHQDGEVMSTGNAGSSVYSGLNLPPAFDAAFSIPGDVSASPGLVSAGLPANDGRTWMAVRN